MLDFFAGSGLVSEALKKEFDVIWANDICAKKADVYCANHQKNVFHLDAIENVKGRDLPQAVLSWGSFPCQDLSLAGNMGGLMRPRSGLVWQWLRVMDEMKKRPPVLVAENVVGLISGGKGEYFRQLYSALTSRGYKVGAVIMDAANWVPQSRKRVFIIGVDSGIPTADLELPGPTWCHPSSLVSIATNLDKWVWWSIPKPNSKRKKLEDVIDFSVPCVNSVKHESLIKLIPTRHLEKMDEEIEKGYRVFPGYKRIRNGKQVLELRFDGLAGCLRTPGGGSSRQYIVLHDNNQLKSRLLTVREAALLMGVRKDYKIPGSYNDGYKAMGDAVAVPAARHLSKYLLRPLSNLAGELIG